MARTTSRKGPTDVLVVRAGPVGLTMACELLRHGIRCRIIDKSDSLSQTSKALRIQPRTEDRLLDYLGNLSLLDDARTPQAARS